MLDEGAAFFAGLGPVVEVDEQARQQRRAESEAHAERFFADWDQRAAPVRAVPRSGAPGDSSGAPGPLRLVQPGPVPPGPVPPGPVVTDRPVPDRLVQLADQVAGLSAVELDVLPGAEVLAVTAGLLQQLEALQTVALTWVAEVERRRLFREDGAGSTSSWVAQQATSMEAKHVALAKRLSRSPAVGGALRAGRLTVEQARRVAAAVAALRPHVDRPDGLIDGQPGEQTVAAVVVDGVRMKVCEAHAGWADDDPRLLELMTVLELTATGGGSQLDRLERALVELAVRIETGLLAGALSDLLDALLPNALERRAADAHADRGFAMVRKADGSGWTITDGDLDLECGERLFTLIAAEQQVDPDSSTDTAAYARLREQGWQEGDPLPPAGGASAGGASVGGASVGGASAGGAGVGGAGDAAVGDVALHGPRSRRQRAHDALSNGLAKALDAGVLGERDKRAAHVAVTVGAETLDGAPGALPAKGASGAALPVSLVRRWACSSGLTRFVLTLGRRVLEVSHTQRTLTGVERRIKHLETGGRCQAAGCCTGPGRRLAPHHATPWAVCGTTRLDDTVLLCDRSHQDLHVGGRPLRLKDGRLLGPQGWVPPEDG